jgi:hypothetical protein
MFRRDLRAAQRLELGENLRESLGLRLLAGVGWDTTGAK